MPCPIRALCLAYAIAYGEQGVWGGLTESQRDRLGPQVRAQVIAEGQAQGWYHERPSIDQIVASLVARPQTIPQLEFETEFQFDFEIEVVQVDILLPIESSTDCQSEQYRLESSEPRPLDFSTPLEELIGALPLPNVLSQAS